MRKRFLNNNIENLIYLGSKTSEYRKFNYYFKNKIEQQKISFMSKEFVDYMISVINSWKRNKFRWLGFWKWR